MRTHKVNNILILLVFLCFVMAGSSAWAHGSSRSHAHDASDTLNCKASKPTIDIKTATTRTKYIRTKSVKDLNQIHGGAAPGAAVGGLGGGEIGFKTEGKFEITEEDGMACVKLKRLEVTFYAKPEIHIASNFGRSSCEHNVVMAHEQGHIRILRKFVREYSPKVKSALAKYAYKIDPAVGPIPKSQVAVAQQRIQKEYMKKLESYQEKMMPVLSKRQQAHDSPAEYARINAKCNKWEEKMGQ